MIKGCSIIGFRISRIHGQSEVLIMNWSYHVHAISSSESSAAIRSSSPIQWPFKPSHSALLWQWASKVSFHHACLYACSKSHYYNLQYSSVSCSKSCTSNDSIQSFLKDNRLFLAPPYAVSCAVAPLCWIPQRFAGTFDYYSHPICAVTTACLMLSGVFGTRSLAVETQNIQAIFLRGAHSSNCALAARSAA